MSLSNPATDTSSWGTIFMGPNRMHETTLSRLETATSGPLWNEATEAEYFERVKAKATEKAREILEAARVEAAAMREHAHQQGYQDGLAEAQAELEEFRQAAGQTAAAVLSAIESQADALTSAWEDELCNLVRAAVEIGIGHELKGHRADILEALFRDAVSTLASEQSAIVYANPEDEPVIADIVASAGEEYARRFQVRGNPDLSPGSVVLESNLGLVENTIESRRNMVDNILNELALRERVEPEAFASDAALHQQLEEVSQLEEELTAAPETQEQAPEQAAEQAVDQAVGEAVDLAVNQPVEQEPESGADPALDLAGEAAPEAEEEFFAGQDAAQEFVEPEAVELKEQEGLAEQEEQGTPEELGSLIPQELLGDTPAEQEAAGEEAGVAEGASSEAVQAAPEAAKAEEDGREVGQAEASQAAADAILDAMFDKDNE